MDQEEPHCSYQPNAKKKKPNDEINSQKSNAVVPASDVNQEQTAAILKLDIDCFEEAFDYLWLRDLVSVSETCKRLNQVAGYCFQQNYLGSAVCEDQGFRNLPHDTKIEAKNLLPFIQKIQINSKGFQYVFDVRSKLRRLEHIHIEYLKEDETNRLKEFSMGKVEVLRVLGCVMSNTFHETLDQCVKLKRLEISRCRGSCNWLDRKYPTLEYLNLRSIEGIPMFLALNPNIRKFATTGMWLRQNRVKIIRNNVKLDDLALKIHYSDMKQSQSMCVLLNKLYEIGFYKKLQLYFMDILIQDMINQFSTVNGLTKLHNPYSIGALAFSAFISLEELYVHDSKFVADLAMLPNKLINLKRVHFSQASIYDLIPFIRRSVNMHKIKVEQLQSGLYFNENTGIIDLLALNKEREQLPGANKTTLYVEEKIYLATKWALGETDLSLVRLKRDTSYEWHHDFSFE